jgi:hypothetical protein
VAVEFVEVVEVVFVGFDDDDLHLYRRLLN